MSQDLRDYDLYRVDEIGQEAHRMRLTATVGPSGHGEIEHTRGVQISLDAPSGTVYARVSEPQVRDLIKILSKRIDADDKETEATGWEAEPKQIPPQGEVE